MKPGIFEGRAEKFPSGGGAGKHAHDYVSYVDKASEKRLYLPLGNCFPKPDSLPKKGLLPIVTKRIAG